MEKDHTRKWSKKGLVSVDQYRIRLSLKQEREAGRHAGSPSWKQITHEPTDHGVGRHAGSPSWKQTTDELTDHGS